MQSCLALKFLVKRENGGAHGRLMNIYIISSCLWPACRRLGRQISARTKTSARLREARLSLPGLYR